MIDIKNKVDCCGCNACGDICPTDAITFKTDIEGFWYPKVDLEKCINCHLCEKTCPIINIKSLKKNDSEFPLKTIAAVNKNLLVRWDSTSGGAYTALAEGTLNQGGSVTGAIYNDNFTVRNYITDNPLDLDKLRSSKYLQSNAEGIYKAIKIRLEKGEKVLACGTPCQMAALRAFLRKDYENLIIVDFICRGVNSPKVYRKYLDSLEKKYGSKIVYIKAKNKELGWRNLTRKVVFENGDVYYGVHMKDDFRRGYHTNVFCRPSCYECVFKGFPRIADITLADYWGIENVNPNLDNNIGTSMILINSKKGEQYFEKVKDSFDYAETPFGSIFKGNVALTTSISLPKINRDSFFKDLSEYGFEYVTDKYYPLANSEKTTFKGIIKEYLKWVKFIITSFGFSAKSYYNFIKINLRNNTQSSFAQKRLLYTMPSAVFDIHPTAKIIINKEILYGNAPVKGMRIPTCLKMTEGTVLKINDGPLTRYGNGPYNLRYGAYIEVVNGGHLTIGQGAANVGLTIMCAKEVIIGNGVRIGRNVSIRDWNGPHVILKEDYVNADPVHIGDHVWLCSGCTIMPGVTIGEGSVIAANATVTKDVPPYSLVGGTPAKVIKKHVKWY